MVNEKLPSKTNAEFCNIVAQSIRAGGGLTPFIGSGLSAQSGILMGQEFDEYLGYVVHLSVEGEGEGKKRRRWNVREAGWPPEPNAIQISIMRKWVCEEFAEICKNTGWKVEYSSDRRVRGISPIDGEAASNWLSTAVATPFVPVILRGNGVPIQTFSGEDPYAPASRPLPCIEESRLRQLHRVVGKDGLKHGGWLPPGISPTSREMIHERAIRSLYDWRSTLQFLSEIKIDDSDGQPRLAESEPDVFDTFNHQITHAKRPNLGHVMLCHLSRVVRSRIFLTTNFDKLIEQAFADVGDHIEEIPVSINGRLPSPAIVHAANTIVKLHGSLSETRADFSLDAPASLADKDRFFHYVRGGKSFNRKKRFLPTDLLVVGFSGSDARCIEMMKYVLDCDPEARIFWLCHSQRDIAKLEKLFSEGSYARRIIATVCQRADLLFYELYQTITLSQPPGGLGHHLSDTLPPDTSIDVESIKNPEERKNAEHFHAVTKEWAKDISRKFPDKQSKVNPIVTIHGGTGILAAMSKFAANDFDNRTVWLEMEDFFHTGSLAYGLFHAIATHRGIYRIGHTCLVPPGLAGPIEPKDTQDAKDAFHERAKGWRKQIETISQRMRINPSEWLVALYGRNGPGGCVGWNDGDFWWEEDYGSIHPEKGSALVAFIGGLAAAGFRVIYAPYPGKEENQTIKHTHDGKLLEHWLENLPKFENVALLHSDWRPGKEYAKAFENIGQDTIASLKKWINAEPSDRKRRQRFSYAISLFRQSRHYTALLRTSAIERPDPFNLKSIDNDLQTEKKLAEYLCEWQHFPRIFHPKPGGYQWLYRDVRLGIRKHAEVYSSDRTIFEFSIAQWYIEAYQVTGHAIPLMEAIYHFYQATCHSHRIKLWPGRKPLPTKVKLCFFWWRKSIVGLISALQSGEQSMLYWLGCPALRAWFAKKSIDEVLKFVNKGNKNSQDVSSAPLLRLLREILERLSNRLAPRPQGEPKHSTRPRSTLQLVGIPFQGYVDSAWLATFLACAQQKRAGHKIPSKEALVKKFRKYRKSMQNIPREPLEVLQLLVETAHEISREAKNCTQANFYVDENTASQPIRFIDGQDASLMSSKKQTNVYDEVQKLWSDVCMHASLALEIISWLPPGVEEFTMREKGKAFMIYGLALARQYRFISAHRFLNNARRVFHTIGNGLAKVQVGVVELRSAEAFLLEAQLARDIAWKLENQDKHQQNVNFLEKAKGLKEWIKTFQTTENGDSFFDQGKLLDLCQARIDDAWICLESAHRLLGYHTHDARWWGRLYAMRLSDRLKIQNGWNGVKIRQAWLEENTRKV
jgi:hypothetical protein